MKPISDEIRSRRGRGSFPRNYFHACPPLKGGRESIVVGAGSNLSHHAKIFGRRSLQHGDAVCENERGEQSWMLPFAPPS